MPTCTERSRQEISTAAWSPTFEEIQAGALQRIAAAAERSATAVEKVAGNWDNLQWRLKNAEESLARARVRENRQERRISALKGVITRMKRKA